MKRMKSVVFVGPGRIALDDKPIPEIGSSDALVKITTTTICGTDIHILKGEYPAERGFDYRARAGRRDLPIPGYTSLQVGRDRGCV